MIIHASERFGCEHRWTATATATGNDWLLVCAECGHRTEQLPLTRLDREMGLPSHGPVVPETTPNREVMPVLAAWGMSVPSLG